MGDVREQRPSGIAYTGLYRCPVLCPGFFVLACGFYVHGLGKATFFCIYQKNVVSLQPQTSRKQTWVLCTSRVIPAPPTTLFALYIIVKAFIGACFGCQKSSKFYHPKQGSNKRLRGMIISLLLRNGMSYPRGR